MERERERESEREKGSTRSGRKERVIENLEDIESYGERGRREIGLLEEGTRKVVKHEQKECEGKEERERGTVTAIDRKGESEKGSWQEEERVSLGKS